MLKMVQLNYSVDFRCIAPYCFEASVVMQKQKQAVAFRDGVAAFHYNHLPV
jgi:hypothetical protein